MDHCDCDVGGASRCLLCPRNMLQFFFFFSSRRRHTISLRDWSSDVCSSDRSHPPAPSVPALCDGRVEIRYACEADLAQIAAIWNHEVLGAETTTDTEPRDPATQRDWLACHTEIYPVIVAVTGHDLVAYGSLSPYQPKPAFARTVEDSVYVR